jgi:bacteriorhodopsin
MVIGTVILTALIFTVKEEERFHAILAANITGIAATAYFAMAKGVGDIMVGGITVQSARYVDWVIATPLLLISLIVVGVNKLKDAGWSVPFVIIVDVYMIVTGLIAGLLHGGSKVFFYVVSSLALLAVAYYIFGPILAAAKENNSAKAKLYTNLGGFLFILWLAYPVVWALGVTGNKSFGFGVENAIYAILDLLAKAVFGIIIVLQTKKLASSAS